MTASELKENVHANGNAYYFTHKTMKFFGDTMRNYGVRSTRIDTQLEKHIECWELYRRRPVKHGLWSSEYFRKDNFHRVFVL